MSVRTEIVDLSQFKQTKSVITVYVDPSNFINRSRQKQYIDEVREQFEAISKMGYQVIVIPSYEDSVSVEVDEKSQSLEQTVIKKLHESLVALKGKSIDSEYTDEMYNLLWQLEGHLTTQMSRQDEAKLLAESLQNSVRDVEFDEKDAKSLIETLERIKFFTNSKQYTCAMLKYKWPIDKYTEEENHIKEDSEKINFDKAMKTLERK